MLVNAGGFAAAAAAAAASAASSSSANAERRPPCVTFAFRRQDAKIAWPRQMMDA